MAKPNYSFDKRQRELKKAKEQEAKRLKKQAQQTAEVNPASSDDAAESPAKER
ncbi:MAG TPA: hypothetical protein VGE51_04835 [Fontimonas sp.]